jgi:hypothetical protein
MCRIAIARSIELAPQQDAELTGLTGLDVGRRGRIGPVPPGPQWAHWSFARFDLQVAQEPIDVMTERFASARRNAAALRA